MRMLGMWEHIDGRCISDSK